MRAVYKIVGEIEDHSPENAIEDSKVYTDLSSGHLKILLIDRKEIS
jgi:hypothetical protein